MQPSQVKVHFKVQSTHDTGDSSKEYPLIERLKTHAFSLLFGPLQESADSLLKRMIKCFCLSELACPQKCSICTFLSSSQGLLPFGVGSVNIGLDQFQCV